MILCGAVLASPLARPGLHCASVTCAAEPKTADAVIGEPAFDRTKSVWRYQVSSSLQRGANAIEVLLPDDYDAARRYRAIYVLPVETGIGGRYGDGLEVIKRIDAHNQQQLICIAPAFDSLPWYMDHASDPQRRHESYLMQVVVPLIEREYSVAPPPEGRMLLGFSKSGWGAFTLLLRHPDFFGFAAAWDSPLMLHEEDWRNWGVSQAAGTTENFRRYQPSRLLPAQAEHFRGVSRFVLLGHKSFGTGGGSRYAGRHAHTVRAHDAMTTLRIGHLYNNDIRVVHQWRLEWVAAAIDGLIELADERQRRARKQVGNNEVGLPTAEDDVSPKNGRDHGAAGAGRGRRASGAA